MPDTAQIIKQIQAEKERLQKEAISKLPKDLKEVIILRFFPLVVTSSHLFPDELDTIIIFE